MDFNLPGEDDPRRREIRAWLEANPSPTYRQLAERGWTAPNWPAPWGLSAGPELVVMLDEELERAGIRHPHQLNAIALNQCGQSLLTWGTEEQRQRFLPPALACEERWCMLFSEPSGGSDLGNLRTTARRVGDDYVINGQKIWNSHADISQIGVIIVRTDSAVPKHKGLSVFILDMKTPGVTVRPIVDMSGEVNEYNEVFLEDVRVPAAHRLGQEGDGWRIVVEQLQTERQGMTMPGAVWGSGPTARELLDGLIRTGRIKNPLIRDDAAKLFIEGELLRLLTYRHLSNKINGKPAGVEGNLGKMIASPHGQRLSDLAKRSQGAAGMVKNRDVLPLPDKHYGLFDNWDYAYWFSPAATLGVGTQEILKNTVAERILGLPRDLDPTAATPFNQINRPQVAPARLAAER
ncbi:acyl-CoA dehydrogenase family protein [Chelatococcus reniformis]|uniref:Acyl-CoA dehydrogenase n=1 Tax=Chelatococcus reniformis TaxID=1494448 RepID=A0A916U406_9HYPH|nr:acyl-CoA dehydrogenase family protein [Chelatococcus reniformis]GGC58848.1 acyl-CoA dehydrogenase [Chelatococcus reniformis]